MNGRLAAYNITAADTPTSVYRCRTDGYGMATVSLVNRGLSTAQLTISIHADSEDTEGDIIEYKTELLPKNVLERSAMTIPSGSYLTIESDVVGISAVVWGTEVGTLDAALDDVSEAPTATQGGSAILDALKRTNNGEQHTSDNPDDGAPVKKIRAEADSTKLRAFINNLGDE